MTRRTVVGSDVGPRKGRGGDGFIDEGAWRSTRPTCRRVWGPVSTTLTAGRARVCARGGPTSPVFSNPKRRRGRESVEGVVGNLGSPIPTRVPFSGASPLLRTLERR